MAQSFGFAVVGSGHLGLEENIPAFAESKKARLAAVVSGDRAKAEKVAREHSLPDGSVYDYKTYDQLRDNPDVQVIYIVLPNGMHVEYTVRGAQAGISSAKSPWPGRPEPVAAEHEARTQRYRVNAEDGWFGMDPAFPYKNLKVEAAHAEDIVEYPEHPTLMPKDQFALELDHMAECVMENKGPYTPGEEGLQDQRIMEALYASAASGKPVKLATPGAGAGKLDLFRGEPPKSS